MSEKAPANLARLQAQLGRVILGKPEAIEHLLVALLAGQPRPHGGRARRGEDDAGQGAGALVLRRLQARAVHAGPAAHGHPGLVDLQPAGRQLHLQGGARSSRNILLADEINRASPRTQSALLEAMSERQVSIEGTTHPLPPPFLVIATQNPIEFHGTYPLPEAQLDRFGLRINLGYPDRSTRWTSSSASSITTRSTT